MKMLNKLEQEMIDLRGEDWVKGAKQQALNYQDEKVEDHLKDFAIFEK